MRSHTRKIGFSEEGFFLFLVFALYVVQVFIVVPGADLSSANYGNYDTITVAGLSPSSWASLAIIVWCFLRIILSLGKAVFPKKTVVCILCIVTFGVIGFLVSKSLSNAVDLGAKIIMPFAVYIYVRVVLTGLTSKSIDRLLFAVNLFLICQVLVCKVATGEFSASHYYTYITNEEYFGYYNSPHPFTAMLGLLSIWNIYVLTRDRMPVLNLALLVGNVILIIASGVRTYALGLAFAVALVMLLALFRPELKRFRIPLLLGATVLLFFGGDLLAVVAGTRFDSSFNTTELSSGRFLRWQLDMGYFLSQSDAARIAFGDGFKASYDVNAVLIGVSINSLNFVIDLLIDNGVFGLTLLLISYACLFLDLAAKGKGPFVFSLLIYLFCGLMLNNLLPYVTVTLASILLLFMWKREGEASTSDKALPRRGFEMRSSEITRA